MTAKGQPETAAEAKTQTYTGFAGRKLIGLFFCVLGVVVTALGSLSLCAAQVLDGSFATNITITVVSGIGTLYATFVGGNYGEHIAKAKANVAKAETHE